MIFGLFKTNQEVKEHFACLVQFLELLARTNQSLGPNAVFHLLEMCDLVVESNETIISGRRFVTFALNRPVDEFHGPLELDENELIVTLNGYQRYAGLMIQSIGLNGPLQVAVTDGQRYKATTRAMWMNSRFVSFGAKDISRFLREMS